MKKLILYSLTTFILLAFVNLIKIYENLNNYEAANYKKKEIDKINKEIEYIDNIISHIEELNCKKYINYDDLYEDIITITDKLLKSEGQIGLGVEIFTRYFSSILPYINYCFNDKKKVKGLQFKVNEIKSIFYRQVLDLISRYNDYLIKMSSIN